MRGLLSTGVPEPFTLEDAKFFVDCYTAEKKFHAILAELGSSCHNREFFKLDKLTAFRALRDLYRTQGEISDYCFSSISQAAFERTIVNGPLDWPELVVKTVMLLPYRKREKSLHDLLAIALERGAEDWAIWLIQHRGVDPETPLRVNASEQYLDLYRLTAYENAIFLRYKQLESYLEGIGCDLCGSFSLCWVIDSLINANRSDEWKKRVVDFGVELLSRGVDISTVLEVGVFANSPRSAGATHNNFRFDIFPRNSRKPCSEVISALSPTNPHFAQLYRAMC